MQGCVIIRRWVAVALCTLLVGGFGYTGVARAQEDRGCEGCTDLAAVRASLADSLEALQNDLAAVWQEVAGIDREITRLKAAKDRNSRAVSQALRERREQRGRNGAGVALDSRLRRLSEQTAEIDSQLGDALDRKDERFDRISRMNRIQTMLEAELRQRESERDLCRAYCVAREESPPPSRIQSALDLTLRRTESDCARCAPAVEQVNDIASRVDEQKRQLASSRQRATRFDSRLERTVSTRRTRLQQRAELFAEAVTPEGRDDITAIEGRLERLTGGLQADRSQEEVLRQARQAHESMASLVTAIGAGKGRYDAARDRLRSCENRCAVAEAAPDTGEAGERKTRTAGAEEVEVDEGREPIATPSPGDEGPGKSQDRLTGAGPGTRERATVMAEPGIDSPRRVARRLRRGPAGDVPSDDGTDAPDDDPFAVVGEPVEPADTFLAAPAGGSGKSIGGEESVAAALPERRHGSGIGAAHQPEAYGRIGYKRIDRDGGLGLHRRPSSGDGHESIESDKTLEAWVVEIGGTVDTRGTLLPGAMTGWQVSVTVASEDERLADRAGIDGALEVAAPDGTRLVFTGPANTGLTGLRRNTEYRDLEALVRLNQISHACVGGWSCGAGWLAGIEASEMDEEIRGRFANAGLRFSQESELANYAALLGVWSKASIALAHFPRGDLQLVLTAEGYIKAGYAALDARTTVAGSDAVSAEVDEGYVGLGGELGAEIAFTQDDVSIALGAAFDAETMPGFDMDRSDGIDLSRDTATSAEVYVKGRMKF